MSPQETLLLKNFLKQLTEVQNFSPDPEAAALIAAAFGAQPHAPYLTVQRTLLLEQALNAAQQRNAQLQAELQAQKAAGSANVSNRFLDPSNTAWGNSVTGTPLYQAAPAPLAAPTAAAPGSFLSGNGGSLLGTVAATAAGVAAGAFLFQGLENLLERPHHDNFGSASLTQGDGELLPGYFDHDDGAAPSDDGN